MKLFKKSFYEKMFAKPPMGLADYYKQIADAQAQIEKMRAECKHRAFEVHMFMWRPGAMQPQRICTTCDAVVPGVTPEETQKAWDEWNKGINTSTGSTLIQNMGDSNE